MPSIETRTKKNGDIYFRARFEWKNVPDLKIEYDKNLNKKDNLARARVIAKEYEDKYKPASKTLFSVYARKTIDIHTEIADSTRSDYLGYISAFINLVGDKPINMISGEDLEEFTVILRNGEKNASQKYRIKKQYIERVSKMCMSKAEMSRQSGVPVTTINAILCGKNVIEQNAEKFAAFLQLSLGEVFEGNNMQNNRSAKTVRNHLSFLNMVFKRALKHGLIDKNPLDVVDKPKVKKEKEMLPFTQEEKKILFLLLGKESIQFRTMITVAVTTGLRRGEVLALRWSDLHNIDDPKKSYIYVQRSLGYVPKKGLFTKLPKNNLKRKVPLNDRAIKALWEYKKYQDSIVEAVGEDWDDSELVFGSLNPKKLGSYVHPDTYSSWWREFISMYSGKKEPKKQRKELAEKSKLHYCRLHDLRHTYCTLLIQSKKFDVTTISKYMGHSSCAVTLKIYTHYFEEINSTDIDAINEVL